MGGTSGWVFPSTETWRSLMPRVEQLCVRGVVRLISSARITLANTGPPLKTNSPVVRCRHSSRECRRGSRWGELDSPERTVDARRDRRARSVLPHAWHVLDQNMPFGQQQNQIASFDHFRLAKQSCIFSSSRLRGIGARPRRGIAASVVWDAFIRYAQRTMRLATPCLYESTIYFTISQRRPIQRPVGSDKCFAGIQRR